jgi:hypothetical protein
MNATTMAIHLKPEAAPLIILFMDAILHEEYPTLLPVIWCYVCEYDAYLKIHENNY